MNRARSYNQRPRRTVSTSDTPCTATSHLAPDVRDHRGHSSRSPSPRRSRLLSHQHQRTLSEYGDRRKIRTDFRSEQSLAQQQLQPYASRLHLNAEWTPNPQDIAFIRRTWSQDYDALTQLGLDIYTLIFANNPEIRKFFPEADRTGRKDAWRESKMFRKQALRFTQVITYSVKYLEQPAELYKYLHELGGVHCRYAARGVFRSSSWQAFGEAIKFAMHKRITGGRFPEYSASEKHLAMLAWERLVVTMCRTMYNGYVQAMVQD